MFLFLSKEVRGGRGRWITELAEYLEDLSTEQERCRRTFQYISIVYVIVCINSTKSISLTKACKVLNCHQNVCIG